ncbi:hypothetical protein [Flavobacterium sangjuense]|uniref:Uncharacterized protein n=1 Tax=Flavobacterium sangjuense TaxID=2518177 RepID=A0A4P7PXP2_9FLAO|nr:hypothetical protein [Flavobacterium sangjuense]QBZ98853.1 hypothetical protein GS03_02365 [Flavobacterium sangjuense]
MVNYLREFQEGLEDFLDLTVYFNENEIRYKFQGLWTSSNFEKDIQIKANKLENLLYRQLKNGLDNKVLLSEVRLKMRVSLNFLSDVYYDDFDNLSKSNLKVRYSSSVPENTSDLFTYEFFQNLKSDEKAHKEFQKRNDDLTMLFDSILKLFERFQKEGKTPSRLQFENLKLLNCIYCYQEILFNLLDKVEHYFYNFEKIDFTILDTNESLPMMETVKCNINLSKVEAAKFFSFLIYDKIIFIDSSDEKMDKIRIQKFIENNFTYKSLNLKQKPITNINKEISEFKLYNDNEFNQTIDDFIKILQSKKR